MQRTVLQNEGRNCYKDFKTEKVTLNLEMMLKLYLELSIIHTPTMDFLLLHIGEVITVEKEIQTLLCK